MSIIKIEKEIRFANHTKVTSMPFEYEDIVTSVFLFGLRIYKYSKKVNLKPIELEALQGQKT